MFGLGFGEIIVILIIALIFIGPKKLPDLARGLGRGLKEFQNAAKGIQDSINNPQQHVQIERPKEEVKTETKAAPQDETNKPS